ncbi:Mechanosensitive ion channel MscS domain-containing protein [Plasmodiophora brassicae]
MSSSGSRYERLPVIHERSSLFRAVDRIEVSESDLDEGAVREPHSRRNSSVVTTAADAEGNVHAFVLDEADQGDYDDERVSLWERFRSWLESNTFVILCLIVALVANAFADKLGYTRATLATPAVFACASIVFDVIEPILFGSISVVSGCLPFKVLVVVASLQTHLHRIALSVVLTVWLEMIERHSDHLLNCMRALTFALVLNLLKDIIMHIVRRSITIRAVLDDIQESDLERDAMVMLCCPDNAARLDERRRWRSDQKRRSLNSKLEAISEGTLDLPLRPLTITDVQQWRYSSETVVRIGTVQQMRVRRQSAMCAQRRRR